jgi:hypothetical protein
MSHPPHDNPTIGLGLTSAVLGFVALLLFFMPILGMPLSAAGLLFGLTGLAAAFRGGTSALRWAVVGILFCSMALGISIAIAVAPTGVIPARPSSTLRPSTPDQPPPPPPARPFL